MTLSDEQIQELLRVGNPSAEECRLIRMGWDAAMRERAATSMLGDILRDAAIDAAMLAAAPEAKP